MTFHFIMVEKRIPYVMKRMRHHVLVSIWIYDVILFSELTEDSREVMKENICVFTAAFTSPPRTGLLSCYCSGSKFTSFHYVRHNDITCLEIYWQVLNPCQSTVSWLTILIQARSVSSLTLTSVSCDKVNYFGVRQRVWLRNEMWE